MLLTWRSASELTCRASAILRHRLQLGAEIFSIPQHLWQSEAEGWQGSSATYFPAMHHEHTYAHACGRWWVARQLSNQAVGSGKSERKKERRKGGEFTSALSYYRLCSSVHNPTTALCAICAFGDEDLWLLVLSPPANRRWSWGRAQPLPRLPSLIDVDPPAAERSAAYLRWSCLPPATLLLLLLLLLETVEKSGIREETESDGSKREQQRCRLFEVNPHSSCSSAPLSEKDEGCRSAGGSLLKGGLQRKKRKILKKRRFVGKRSSFACTFSRLSQLNLSASTPLLGWQVILGYPAVVLAFFFPPYTIVSCRDWDILHVA